MEKQRNEATQKIEEGYELANEENKSVKLTKFVKFMKLVEKAQTTQEIDLILEAFDIFVS